MSCESQERTHIGLVGDPMLGAAPAPQKKHHICGLRSHGGLFARLIHGGFWRVLVSGGQGDRYTRIIPMVGIYSLSLSIYICIHTCM